MSGVYFYHPGNFAFSYLPWADIRKIERCDHNGLCVTLANCPASVWIYLIEGTADTTLALLPPVVMTGIESRVRTLYDDLVCCDVDIDITYTAEKRCTETGVAYWEYVRCRGRPARTEGQLPAED